MGRRAQRARAHPSASSTGENAIIQHTTHVCLDNDYEEGEPTRIDISDAGLEANLLFSVVVGDEEADLLSLNLSIKEALTINAQTLTLESRKIADKFEQS